MPNTIRDVETLGYQVGIAQGDVAAEEEALDQARAETTPERLAENTQAVTAQTIADLTNIGAIPDDPNARREIATRIADVALTQLTERAAGRVEFHERAVEIAKEMPDVWVITGPGVTNAYVACKPDGTGWDEESQAFLDALANPDAHKERGFQHYAPGEVVALALEARALGADVQGQADETRWRLKINGTAVTTLEQLETVVAKLRP